MTPNLNFLQSSPVKADNTGVENGECKPLNL